MKKDKGLRLLKILEILRQETDEDHHMGTERLRRRLSEYGIDCDRRTLYNDIDTLNDGGYEILTKNSTSNEYYVIDRDFDLPEIQILMDAVQAASFIKEDKTRELVDKIAQLAGSNRGDVLKKNLVKYGTAKVTNNVIFSVNEINEAIYGKKKISFNYFHFNLKHERVFRTDEATGNKKLYVVNPCATVFNNDKYYLFCYDDKHGNVVQYRVDRMDAVKVLDEPITPSEEAKKLDLSKHKRQMFEMYGGEKERVVLRAKNDSKMLDVVFDTFGDEVRLREVDGEAEFAIEVQVSDPFIAWCCSFGDGMRAVAPQKVVDRIKSYISTVQKAYAD